MKQILKGNKARCEQYVMKNAKKKIHLDIVVDVKYLKGKRDKKGCENCGNICGKWATQTKLWNNFMTSL